MGREYLTRLVSNKKTQEWLRSAPDHERDELCELFKEVVN
jgi:hypothetical protein